MLKKIPVFDNIISALFVLYGFWALSPYFTWSTFRNGMFYSFLGIPTINFIFVALLFMCILYFIQYGMKISKTTAGLTLSMLIIGVILIGVCGGKFLSLISLAWRPYIVLCFFLLMPIEKKIRCYEYFLVVFTVTLIPSILIYFCGLLGIQVPYDVLMSTEKIKSNLYYAHYPFAVQLVGGFTTQWRLCGIYDEPGKLGTIAALVLASQGYKFKGKWYNVVILLAGICSFSLAFFMLSIIYFIAYNIKEQKFKNAIYLALILFVYLIFTNVQIDNSMLSTTQSRIQITSEGLSGDNRTSSAYDDLFTSFLHSGVLSLVFGKGEGTIGTILTEELIDGSSYKNLIYDYGFIGFGLIIFWVIYAVVLIRKSSPCKSHDSVIVAIALVYLCNIYQRPFVFHFPYMLIYLGGIYSQLYYAQRGISESHQSSRLKPKRTRLSYKVGCSNE